MPISLHTATVGPYLQVLPSMVGLIDKAEEHCRANNLPDEALTAARLADDMWPFAKQVTASAYHSRGAIEAARAGVFGPNIDSVPIGAPPSDFATLRANTNAAIAMLQGVTPEEIDSLVGRDMRFEFGEMRLDFTVEDFLLTFSLTNFFFHSGAAYSILRNQGLPIGKMDFMGQLRLKG